MLINFVWSESSMVLETGERENSCGTIDRSFNETVISLAWISFLLFFFYKEWYLSISFVERIRCLRGNGTTSRLKGRKSFVFFFISKKKKKTNKSRSLFTWWSVEIFLRFKACCARQRRKAAARGLNRHFFFDETFHLSWNARRGDKASGENGSVRFRLSRGEF